MLESCLDAGSKLSWIKKLSNISSELLKEVGPAIMSSFHIHEDYKGERMLSCLEEAGPLQSERRETHAIMIIGAGTDIISGRECQIFLGQNWTREKQFISVHSKQRTNATEQPYLTTDHRSKVLLTAYDNSLVMMRQAGLDMSLVSGVCAYAKADGRLLRRECRMLSHECNLGTRSMWHCGSKIICCAA